MTHNLKQQAIVFGVAMLLGMLALRPMPVWACEVVIPPNYLYREHFDFDESSFPPGLSVNQEMPEWAVSGGFVGYLGLENVGNAEIYLLYPRQLSELDGVESGTAAASSVWSRGLKLPPAGSFDVLGEAPLSELAAGLEIRNASLPEGGPITAEVPSAQLGEWYMVSSNTLYRVGFEIGYRPNPDYKPEGTFVQFSLADKIGAAPVIVLGQAIYEAGYENRQSTTVQVEKWLKGSGDTEIIVNGFGATSCDYQIEAGGRRIFFMEQDGDGFKLHGFQDGMLDAVERPEVSGQIAELTGLKPADPAVHGVEPMATVPAGSGTVPTVPKAGRSDNLFVLWLLGGLLLATAVGAALRRRDREH